MPTPRKRRTKKTPDVNSLIDLIIAEANQDRGSAIQKLATTLKTFAPLDIQIPNEIEEDDSDSLIGSSSNVAVKAPSIVKVQPIKKRMHPSVRLSGSTLMLGADPEFVVVDSRGSRIDCSSMDRELSFGNIGFDHSGRCAELRPNPGMPKDLIENMRQLIAHIRDSKPGKKLVAGGGAEFDIACGGHIHFNIRNFNFTDVQKGRDDGEDQSLLHALDSFIGRKLLKMNGAKRARPNSTPYGFPSDWRDQPHGFEYRTPPSFIGDPIFAESVFAVAYRIVKVWMENNNAFDDMNGRLAKRREYSMLIPSAEEVPSTADRDYWRAQISIFIKTAWDSEFKLNNDDMIEKWTAGIPVKSVWKTVKLNFQNDDNIDMELEGSVIVPTVSMQENSINVVALPEWQNFRDSDIVVSKSIYDTFNFRARRRAIERNGFNFVAIEGTSHMIGIPYKLRINGNRYIKSAIENLFRALELETDVQMN